MTGKNEMSKCNNKNNGNNNDINFDNMIKNEKK